jgi:hypothetical protein
VTSGSVDRRDPDAAAIAFAAVQHNTPNAALQYPTVRLRHPRVAKKFLEPLVRAPLKVHGISLRMERIYGIFAFKLNAGSICYLRSCQQTMDGEIHDT